MRTKIETLIGTSAKEKSGGQNIAQKPSTKTITTPYSRFLYAISSEATLGQYERHLREFLQFVNLLPPQEKTFSPLTEEAVLELYKRAKDDLTWFNDSLISYILYQKSHILKKEISGSTLRNMYKPVKLFCDMNDILLNWRLITRGMPPGKRSGNDRTPTIDEIRKLLDHTDIRIKPIVLLMVSSGIRLGAWAFLKWKHVTPLFNDQGVLLAGRLIVYAGEPEQYFTFMTPEAYNALKDWMDFRASYGEIITAESWLMRDIWRTTSIPYGTRKGRAKFPKKLSHVAIRGLINRALFKQNVRPLLQVGEKSHEFKALHGFRKLYKTTCERGGMKPANVELLIGHEIGISSSYYKPTESQLLEDYLGSAVGLLTINEENRLTKKVIELEERNKDNEYLINRKLREKDEEIDKIKEDATNKEEILNKLLAEVATLKNDVKQERKRWMRFTSP